jgi:4'-phosphopantetheinyl transferase
MGRSIGVDVEKLRPMPDLRRLSQRYFSANEFRRVQSSPEDQRIEAFFRCWTCKEAYLKACGVGLSLALDRFEVAFAKGEPVCLLHVEGEPDEPGRWWMADIAPGPGYVAAAAVEHGPCSLSFYLF